MQLYNSPRPNKILGFFSGKNVYYLFFLLSVLLNVFLGRQVYLVTKEYENFKRDPQAVVLEENNALISRVGELTELPQDEAPTIATVTDRTLLEGQPFFANAMDGDKILLYTNAKRAFLYRPSEHKLINVASVNLTGNVAGVSDTVTPQPINIINMSVLAGSSEEAANSVNTIKGSLPELPLNVVGSGVSVNTYDKTLVVDVSAKHSAQVSQIAQALNAEVVALPEGEQAPSGTDVLIIVPTKLTQSQQN